MRPWLSLTTTARLPSSVLTLLYPSAAWRIESEASPAITSATICSLVETIVPRPGTYAAYVGVSEPSTFTGVIVFSFAPNTDWLPADQTACLELVGSFIAST